MNPRPPARLRRGFVLLEAMIAVAIFALGVLTLGRCVSNCIAAEKFKNEDARARLALENRLAAIEAGAIAVDKPITEDLEGPFAGLRLQQTSSPLHKENEKREELTGLLAVQVEVSWRSSSETHTKQITVYVPSRKL